MPHSLVLSHPFRGRKEWELRKSSHDRLCSNFAGCTMTFVRSMGRWTMTALVINCIIGGGIFGLPGELTRLLGQASPFAMIFAALGMALILACFAEVASQFSEPGGAYLYVRTAFGGFAGMQIGWFDLLNVIGTVAALANLFVDYLAPFLPGTLNIWNRALVMAILIAVPAAANYRGVRSGANLSSLMTLAKLLPLALLVLVGATHFARQPQLIQVSEITSPGLSNWVRALAFLLWAFGGWEDSVLPTGEVREPRRTIPFSLGMGLLGCAVIYTLLQFIVVGTIGTRTTDAPLTVTASVLLGRSGAAFVAIAALVSIYGWISAAMLYGPRLTYSLAAQGEFPALFARLHPRFHTPAAAILLYALTAWVLAASGTFLWLVAVTAGSMMVLYAAVCASLIRLRKLRPNVDAFRIPFGSVLSIIGIAIAVGLMTGLKRSQLLMMCVTAAIAAANWLWAKRRRLGLEAKASAATAPLSLS
jgi:basic amino acid/polyamine antiporter, APA family